MSEFSFFTGPITNKFPKAIINLKVLADNISSDEHLAKQTARLRTIQDKDKRQEFKNTFCYVTFGGTFNERRANAIISPSGLICADLDHIGNNGKIKAIQTKIRQYITPALMFISPSGDGLKVVFKIDLNEAEYLEYFIALENFFNNNLNIQIDRACKNISQATFLCHDPEVFYCEEGTILNKEFISPVPELNILTEDTDLFEKLKTWTDTKETFIKGSRNAYITQLAGACNRFGINEDYALTQLRPFAQEDFTAEEIEATVKSIYGNTQWHGTVNNLDDLDGKPPEAPAITTPLLPIDGLPECLQDIITECSRIYGTHRDFWTGAIIAASALALGNNYRLKTQYTNGAVLWLAIVAKTGTGKTEPLNFAFRPLHNLDDQAIKNYEKTLSEYEHARRMDKKQKDEGIVINAEMPTWIQYIISDITPEAIFTLHKFNPRGICMLRDELRGWIDDFGRYNKSGEESTWLTSWSEQPITINRKLDKPLKIAQPFICVAGGLQPSELGKMAEDNRAVNGFMQRICFVYPDNAIRPDFTGEELPYLYQEEYENYILKLLAINNPTPEYIRLDAEATEIFKHFNNKLTNEINSQDDDFLTGVYAKLPIITLRLALVIHFSNQTMTNIIYPQIRAESMRAAINMADYFRLTGEKVGRELNSSTITGLNKKNIAIWLNNELGWNQKQIAKILKITRQYASILLKKE